MATQVRATPAYNPILQRRKVKNAEKDRHYRWVVGDQDRIDFLVENYGYKVERNKDLKSGNPEGLDGAITSGPSSRPDILMSCPKAEWETRQKERELAVAAQLEGPRETFKTEAGKVGVETEDKTKSYRGTIADAMGEK